MVGDDGAPAQPARRPAELLGGVDRADRDDPRRRAQHLGEDRLAVELEHAARSRLDRVGTEKPPLACPLALQHGHLHRGLRRVRQLVLETLDEHVDLAAAGQSDLQGHVVRDPVGQEAGLAVDEHIGRLDGDVALDAAAGDRAEAARRARRRPASPPPDAVRSGVSQPRSPARPGRPGRASARMTRRGHARAQRSAGASARIGARERGNRDFCRCRPAAAGASDLRGAPAGAAARLARPDDRLDRAADDRRRPRRHLEALLGRHRRTCSPRRSSVPCTESWATSTAARSCCRRRS